MRNRIAIAVCLAMLFVVGIRPLISESYATGASALAAALDQLSEPSPLVTSGFNLLILLCLAVTVTAGFSIPATGLAAGTALLTVIAVVSAFNAQDARVAINATFDWLCYPAVTALLATHLRHEKSRRLFLAFILAGAALQAAKCLDDKYRGFEETWTYYQEHKSEIWEAQGVPLDSDKVELFERRMLAREASGYFPHSNVAGSYFALAALVAVGCLPGGLRVARRGKPFRAIGAGVLGIMLLFAVIATGSQGATIALAIGVLLWILTAAARIRGRSVRIVTLAGSGLLAFGGAAMLVYGLIRGGLPGASLNFRWQYWTIFQDHPWLGVGRENFGPAYLLHKTIDVAEEVANPHNLVVQFACDFGIPGLIALAAMIGGILLVLMAPPESTDVLTPDRNEDSSHPLPADSHDNDRATATTEWTGVKFGLAFGVVMLLIRLTLVGTDDTSYLYYVGVTSCVIWSLGFIVAMNALPESSERALTWSLAAGLAAFIVHDMINFAMFVPGSATTFFAVLGVLLSRYADTNNRSRWGGQRWDGQRWAVLAWSAVMCALVLVFAIIPMSTGARWKKTALEASTDATGTDAALLAAIQADPWDPTPILFRARYWMSAYGFWESQAEEGLHAVDANRQALAALALAFEAVRTPATRVSDHLGFRRLQAEIATEVGSVGLSEVASEDALALAATARKEAVRLYPGDPRGWLKAGESLRALATAGGLTDSERREALRESLEYYEAGLQLEKARPEWERIRGLRDREIATARAAINEIQQTLDP